MGPDLLSQSIQAQSLAMCVFKSFPGEDQQFSNDWPGYPWDLQLLKPMFRKARAHPQEKPLQQEACTHNKEQPPLHS